MAKLNDDWIVQPHGPVEHLDEGLLSVAGEIVMPLGRFPRRMTVAALSEGRLAVWSPIPLEAAGMAELERMGTVAFLIVPGVHHRLDIRAWKGRYPAAKVVCAQGALDAVEEAVPVDCVVEAHGEVLNDAEVALDAPPGVEETELAMTVRRGERLTLVLNDILANVQHPHGIGAQVMARLFGFGVKAPQMPRPVRKAILKDRKLLAAAFRQWAAEPQLARIVVSHGEVITDEPAEVLKRIARDLDG